MAASNPRLRSLLSPSICIPRKRPRGALVLPHLRQRAPLSVPRLDVRRVQLARDLRVSPRADVIFEFQFAAASLAFVSSAAGTRRRRRRSLSPRMNASSPARFVVAAALASVTPFASYGASFAAASWVFHRWVFHLLRHRRREASLERFSARWSPSNRSPRHPRPAKSAGNISTTGMRPTAAAATHLESLAVGGVPVRAGVKSARTNAVRRSPSDATRRVSAVMPPGVE